MNRGSDICQCGDYRSQHDKTGCRTCKNSGAPWDGCTAFRFACKADADTQKHWSQHHGRETGKETMNADENAMGAYIDQLKAKLAAAEADLDRAVHALQKIIESVNQFSAGMQF